MENGWIAVQITNGVLGRRTKLNKNGVAEKTGLVAFSETVNGDTVAKFRIVCFLAKGKTMSYSCIAFDDAANTLKKIVEESADEKKLSRTYLCAEGDLNPVPTDDGRDAFILKVYRIRRMPRNETEKDPEAPVRKDTKPVTEHKKMDHSMVINLEEGDPFEFIQTKED